VLAIPEKATVRPFCDVDGDGWTDLLMTRTAATEPALLYLNQRNGRFVEGGVSWMLPLGAVGGLFVDHDSDGDQDLYLIIHHGPNELHRNDDGVFAIVPQPTAFRASRVATAALFADLDGDGVVELFSTHRFWQPNQWVHRPGTPDMVDLGRLVSPLRAGNDAFSATPFDFDGDADLDVYVSSFSGSNLLQRNNGTGQFHTMPEAAGMASERASIAALPADVNGDGRLDLYVINAIGQSNQMFVSSVVAGSDTRYLDVTLTAGMHAAGNSSGGAWADFDNDGDEDLLVSHVAMPIRGYRNDGDVTFTDMTGTAVDLARLPKSGTTGVAIDDIDRDGDIDVFLTSAQSTDVLLVNDSDDADWIRITPGSLGVQVGTRIETVTDVRRQVREFAVASSVGTQHGGLLHFGLGAGAPDSVALRITIPSGATQTVTAATGQVLTLHGGTSSQDLALARVLSPGLAPRWQGFEPSVEVGEPRERAFRCHRACCTRCRPWRRA